MRATMLSVVFLVSLIAPDAFANEEPRTLIEVAADNDALVGKPAVELVPVRPDPDIVVIRNVKEFVAIEPVYDDGDTLDSRRAIDMETRKRILELMDPDKISAVATAKQCIATIVNSTLKETDRSFRHVRYASKVTLTEHTNNPL